jgi:prepilin-type processing-associated H-X9-DG protein
MRCRTTTGHDEFLKAPAARPSGRLPANRGMYPPREIARRGSRVGLSAVEVMVAVAIVGLAAALAIPWILQARAASRRLSCRDHMRTLTLALNNYYAAHDQYPPAAFWSTSHSASVALHRARRIDVVTHENWAQLLLPFAGEEALAKRFDSGRSIGDPVNAAARTLRLPLMACPDDRFNRDDNRYKFDADESLEEAVEFARGNYAINGGTQGIVYDAPSTAYPRGDVPHRVINTEPRLFQFWGNGIAGINRSFAHDDFTNRLSTVVALEEVRAGIHPLDTRGAWALGQIGASVTSGHGVNSDDFSPNRQWERSDDILGCQALHDAVGKETLAAEGMPCVIYIDDNVQATSRSLHAGGVHVSFLDGSVRFISDAIDAGLWHVIHSRETPADVLDGDFDERLSLTDDRTEAPPPDPPAGAGSNVAASAPPSDGPLVNSIGMTFVAVPAGEFAMGLADIGNDGGDPLDCPPHPVRITRPYRLGIHEVTRGQFDRLMGTHAASERPEVGADNDATDSMPAAGVTWNDAAEFCRRLSLVPEEREAGRRYRLPTEAEWEFACRDGQSEPYQWQPRPADDKSGEAAGLQPMPIKPVGSYPPNQLGLYDMRGNVWEWTADWFDREYYLRSPADDPRGPARGYFKVLRGSDWRFIGEICRIDAATPPPWQPNPVVGFRVVCVTATRHGYQASGRRNNRRRR